MDTTHLEYTAEDLIAHTLQRNGLLVAKPKFDRDGADLIALLDVADGAKFCRIQCKGRSLKNNNNSNVKIPSDYVSGSFFCFLYVDNGDEKTYIFCFSVNDIKIHWNLITEKNKEFYSLNIYKNTFINQSNGANILSFSFVPEKIDFIKEDIKHSISKNEITLIELVKKQKELLEITNKHNELNNILTEIRHLEELQKLHGENFRNLTQQYKDMLPEFEKELPENLIQKINELAQKSMPVSEIMEQANELIPIDIPREILDDFISNVVLRK